MQAITLRMDDETFQLLHEIAEEDNKPSDEIMIELLRQHLETLKEKSCSSK